MRRDIIRGVILVDLPSARMCAVRSCRYVEVECDLESAPGLLIEIIRWQIKLLHLGTSYNFVMKFWPKICAFATLGLFGRAHLGCTR